MVIAYAGESLLIPPFPRRPLPLACYAAGPLVVAPTSSPLRAAATRHLIPDELVPWRPCAPLQACEANHRISQRPARPSLRVRPSLARPARQTARPLAVARPLGPLQAHVARWRGGQRHPDGQAKPPPVWILMRAECGCVSCFQGRRKRESPSTRDPTWDLLRPRSMRPSVWSIRNQ